MKRGINTSEFWFLMVMATYFMLLYTVPELFVSFPVGEEERVHLLWCTTILLSVYGLSRAIAKFSK